MFLFFVDLTKTPASIPTPIEQPRQISAGIEPRELSPVLKPPFSAEDFMDIKSIIAIGLDQDSCVTISMSYVVDPSLFYINIVSAAENLIAITEGLEHYRRFTSNPVNITPELGALCAGFDKNALCRARIMDIQEADCEVMLHLFYIDFGHTAWVRSQRVYELPDYLHDFASQAICCCLAGIVPSTAMMMQLQESRQSNTS